MKARFYLLVLVLLPLSLMAQETTIKLLPHSNDKGLSVMKALEQRASASEFDTAMLKLQDLSDLLWAANGVNRPESGKRTAPSAMNSQDVDVYVVMKKGTYFCDPAENVLKLIAAGDFRALVAGRQGNVADVPLFCLLVSDISKFKNGDESLKLNWAAMDAGIVSQNISVFCASAGLSTRPRVTMETEKLKTAMKLKDTQYLIMNNPVSYKKM